MNREIKFRAWDTIDECWIPNLSIFATEGVHGNNRIQTMQFTGMFDKNNKEICEGDIIELVNEDGETIHVLCEYGTARRNINGNLVDITGFYFKLESGFKSFPIAENYLGKHDLELFEIIGNVYETPELFNLVKKDRKFKAGDKPFEFTISESKLKSTPLTKLVQILNENGFGLGSGHDGLYLENIGDEYHLICSPYLGHFDQIITFKLIED